MSQAMSKLVIAAAAAIAGAATGSQLATGQAGRGAEVFALADNDGIVVDKTSFKGIIGNGAKADPAATLARLGAQEVRASAIIYRSGDKLYIVDAALPGDAPKQFLITLEEWCPTCHWYTPGSY